MIKILLAEDHVVVRNGIKSMLEKEADISIVGEADNGLEVLSLLENGLEADIVLTDISMPQMDGIVLSKELQKTYPGIHVIILSMMDNEQYIFDAFGFGIKGYLLKNTSVEEVLFAIRLVSKRKQALCMDLAMRMLKRAAKLHIMPIESNGMQFTPRELEVLSLISEGFTNQEIAEKTFTSKRTVEGHRQNLIEKAGVKNSAQLIKFACKTALI